jgi:hypothetical protein
MRWFKISRKGQVELVSQNKLRRTTSEQETHWLKLGEIGHERR